MDSNKPAITAGGDWLMAFWREQGGSAACERNPEMHGVPGVLLSSDQARPQAMPGCMPVRRRGRCMLVELACCPRSCGHTLRYPSVLGPAQCMCRTRHGRRPAGPHTWSGGRGRIVPGHNTPASVISAGDSGGLSWGPPVLATGKTWKVAGVSSPGITLDLTTGPRARAGQDVEGGRRARAQRHVADRAGDRDVRPRGRRAGRRAALPLAYRRHAAGLQQRRRAHLGPRRLRRAAQPQQPGARPARALARCRRASPRTTTGWCRGSRHALFVAAPAAVPAPSGSLPAVLDQGFVSLRQCAQGPGAQLCHSTGMACSSWRATRTAAVASGAARAVLQKPG